ncbi:MAG: hypothetical protein ACMVP2_05740 [Imperialibacter sp.]|uniref:hypothetical protein n=1 Tax=Imperialibacter sp. TaxID=2038411 RepID=UPI003A842B0C
MSKGFLYAYWYETPSGFPNRVQTRTSVRCYCLALLLGLGGAGLAGDLPAARLDSTPIYL